MNDPEIITDEEFLYRKVSVNSRWYNAERQELKPDALKPQEPDSEGISFDRARSELHPKFRSVEEAGVGMSAGGYYVAVFNVGQMRARGFRIVADPLDENPGHALLTDLTYQNRKDDESMEKMVLLAHELLVRVEGPFLPTED